MRYTDEELESLLDDIESDLAERKESWKGDAPDTGRQAVCAFDNDLPDHRRPGVLFVGGKNDGTPSGLPITDELLRTLSDIRTDGNILSPPSIIVDKRTLKGGEMAVVTVQPSDSPPVRYKGRIWVRFGHSIFGGVHGSIGNALVADLARKESLARGLSLFSATAWIGGVLGFGAAGYAFQHLGVSATLVVGIGLILISILLLIPIQGRRPTELETI